MAAAKRTLGPHKDGTGPLRGHFSRTVDAPDTIKLYSGSGDNPQGTTIVAAQMNRRPRPTRS